MGLRYALEYYKPTLHFPSIAAINFEWLRELGITKALVDLDGTLAAILSERYETETLDALLGYFNPSDICVFSNTGVSWFVPRVRRIAERLGCEFLACYPPHAMKPMPRAFGAAIRLVNGCSRDTVMIGDQLGRDILGANLVGIPSILVKTIPPIPWWKMPTHHKEQKLLRRLGIEF